MNKSIRLLILIPLAALGITHAVIIPNAAAHTILIDIDIAGGTTTDEIPPSSTVSITDPPFWNSVPAAQGLTQHLKNFEGVSTKVNIEVTTSVSESLATDVNALQADGIQPSGVEREIVIVIDGLVPFESYSVRMWTVTGRCRFVSLGDGEEASGHYIGGATGANTLADSEYNLDRISVGGLRASSEGSITLWAQEALAFSSGNPVPAPTIAGIEISGEFPVLVPYRADLHIFDSRTREFTRNDIYANASHVLVDAELYGVDPTIPGAIERFEMTYGPVVEDISGRWIRRRRGRYAYRRGAKNVPVRLQNDGDLPGLYIASEYFSIRAHPIEAKYFDGTGNITAAVKTIGNYGYTLNPGEFFQFSLRMSESARRARQQRRRNPGRARLTVAVVGFSAEDPRRSVADAVGVQASSNARRKPRLR